MHDRSIDANASWNEFLDLLRDADQITKFLSQPKDSQLGMEACAQLLMSLAQGYAFNFRGDPDFPHFTPNFHWPNASLGNNPDTTYYCTPINAQGTYRIWGKRNNIRMVDFQIGESFYGGEDGRQNKSLASYDMQEMGVDADGSFEFILSAQRPSDCNGEWRWMPPTAENIIVRQVAYDWFTEEEAELRIVRLDAPGLTPKRPSAEQYRKALRAAAIYAVKLNDQFTRYPHMLRNQGFVNGRVHTNDFSDVGGFSDQVYYDGIFDLEPDEALILEMPVPARCRYWNLQLINEFLGGTDYIFCHGSLNGHQAHIDSDGKFRGVIAHQDPGVANWLDTDGLKVGVYMGRWRGADSHPLPKITKVNFVDIDKYMPADTVRMTPKERAELVLARRIVMLNRIGH